MLGADDEPGNDDVAAEEVALEGTAESASESLESPEPVLVVVVAASLTDDDDDDEAATGEACSRVMYLTISMCRYSIQLEFTCALDESAGLLGLLMLWGLCCERRWRWRWR